MTIYQMKLAELAARFASRVPEERAALTLARRTGDRIELRDRAHKLAGIAPMFGHDEIGEAALALEAAAEKGDAVDAAAFRLDRLLRSLELTG